MLTATARGDFAEIMLPTLMMKLYGTDLRGLISELAYELIGSSGLIAPNEAEQRPQANAGTPGAWTARMMGAIAISIAGGTSNIQRNIIGERGFGLPRDLRRGK